MSEGDTRRFERIESGWDGWTRRRRIDDAGAGRRWGCNSRVRTLECACGAEPAQHEDRRSKQHDAADTSPTSTRR
jgi:hypothetical protein